MYPCKLSPFLSSLGPAAGTLPHSCLGRSDKAEDLWRLPQKYKEGRRKGKGCGAGLSLYLCSSLGGLCMQRQANTTILWTPALGKQACLWRSCFTALNFPVAEGLLLLCSKVKADTGVVCELARGAAVPPQCCCGCWQPLLEPCLALLVGWCLPRCQSSPVHRALGALLATLPLWVAFCPPVWGKWQHSKALLKEDPSEEGPCLSDFPDKMCRQKGA